MRRFLMIAPGQRRALRRLAGVASFAIAIGWLVIYVTDSHYGLPALLIAIFWALLAATNLWLAIRQQRPPEVE